MQADVSYREYAADNAVMARTLSYQDKYITQVKESDRVLIAKVQTALTHNPTACVLDIGCGTGNLLRHLQTVLPQLQLVGGEFGSGAVAKCQADPALRGIQFEDMNILDLPYRERFDVIIANAVTYLFETPDYERALRNIAQALKPGGCYLSYEWIHPFAQEIRIVETSGVHPQGHPIHARPAAQVTGLLHKAGLAEVALTPFSFPIDLGGGEEQLLNPSDPTNINTYTVPTAGGRRLLFRGAIYQPWCHLRARKTSHSG